MFSKKGVSNVVGTVLLIVLVLVIGVVVFVWSGSYIGERSERAEREVLGKELCDDTRFVVENVCYSSSSVENVETRVVSSKKHIRFNVGNNNPYAEIYSFLVFLDYVGRRVNTLSLPHDEIVGFGSDVIYTDFIEGDVNRMRIVPKLLFEDNFIICDERELIVEGEDIGESC